MAAIQSKQRIRILTLQIAVADELSWLLSENGIYSESSKILDWRSLTEFHPQVVAGDKPQEGEVFGLLDFKLIITPKE